MEVALSAIRKIFIVCTLSLLLIPAIQACSGGGMPVGEGDVNFEYKIPQIDIDVPVVIETATFAMG